VGDIWNAFVGGMTSVIDFFATITGGYTAVGIILFTICVRSLMLPLTLKAVRSSRAMQQLQPYIKEINKKYEPKKGERLPPEKAQAKQAEIMKLYSEFSINPAASCLPVLIQLPLFFAVYSAVRGSLGDPDPLIKHLNTTWHFFTGVAGISTGPVISDNPFPFFWLNSLNRPDPLYILPVLMVLFQFTTQKMAIPRGGGADEQQRRINGIMQWTPLIFGFTALQFPAGPVVYWVTTSVYSAIQQFFITGWGSLADLPGLGFLPAKKLPTVQLKRKEIVAGAPERKTWMQRMQSNQERLAQQKQGDKVVSKDSNESLTPKPVTRQLKSGSESADASSDTVTPLTKETGFNLKPTRTSAKISIGSDGAADSSPETTWQDEEVDSSSMRDKTTRPERRSNANMQNAYDQLNRRPPKRGGGSVNNPGGGNGNGKSRKR